MKIRLVIITEIISPYRIPLFNALAREAAVELHVIFLSETDPELRQWLVYKNEIHFSYEVLPSRRYRVAGYTMLLNYGLTRQLRAFSPDVILCGGYNYPASWQALLWARTYAVPFLLWSESNEQDARDGYAFLEILKSAFLRSCSGFVVPGRSASAYLLGRKISQSQIFTAPNAVDNSLFAAAADLARKNASARRSQLGMPERYILFVGRLVREKGVFDLLSAYATLDAQTRAEVGLVYAGDGVCRIEMEKQSASISPGTVKFAGFVQRDDLAPYYALAEMLVLPTYTDTWGLVVNEAMSCGLPIVLSQVAGCAADLVADKRNGLLVPPGDPIALAQALRTLISDSDSRARMASANLQLISHYSPAAWSRHITEALAAMKPKND